MVLRAVREETGLLLLTDIHEPWQAEPVRAVGISFRFRRFRRQTISSPRPRTGRRWA